MGNWQAEAEVGREVGGRQKRRGRREEDMRWRAV